MKFPSTEEMAKEVAEKALDEYVYQGKTIRQWVDILKDYDDKQTTLQRIVERLKTDYSQDVGFLKMISVDKAIEIVKEEGQ